MDEVQLGDCYTNGSECEGGSEPGKKCPFWVIILSVYWAWFQNDCRRTHRVPDDL